MNVNSIIATRDSTKVRLQTHLRLTLVTHILTIGPLGLISLLIPDGYPSKTHKGYVNIARISSLYKHVILYCYLLVLLKSTY
jgi:hypothetical protein